MSKLRENVPGPGGLHFLDMTNSNAGPKELSAIADCIKHNFQTVEGVAPLISIDFSGNRICGVDFLMTGVEDSSGLQDFVKVLTDIGGKSRLRKLILSRNYLDLRAYTCLSNLITTGPQSISELYLRDCGATAETMTKLMEGVKAAKNLQILDISHNYVEIEGCEAIGDALSVNSKIRQLLLNECDIGPVGMSAIAKGLSHNLCLETLFLGDNGIGDEGAAAVASMLRTNSRIRQLDLQENGICLSGITELCNALKTNRSLAFLGLQWNELSNDAALPLSEMLSMNNVLRAVHIIGTQIDEAGVRKIMDASIQIGEKRIDIDLGFLR